ncbi:MAG: hypothetical protein MRY72_12310, partial [Aquisalinus sp.]|nr:hypothetical protein [Aquisalinus sp.]
GGEAIYVGPGSTLRWIINNSETSRVAGDVNARIEDAAYYFEDATTVTFNNTAANVPEIVNDDGAITAGSNSFSSPLGTFPTNIVGKYIVIEGAGPGGAGLSALITARPNDATLTLDRTASTTVSGASYAAQNGYTFKLKNSNAIKFQNIRMVQTAGMFLEGCSGIHIDQCKYFFDDVGTADGEVGHVIDLLNCDDITYNTGAFGALQLSLNNDGIVQPIRIHPSSTKTPTGSIQYAGVEYGFTENSLGDRRVIPVHKNVMDVDMASLVRAASAGANDLVLTRPVHLIEGFDGNLENINHLWWLTNGGNPTRIGQQILLISSGANGTINFNDAATSAGRNIKTKNSAGDRFDSGAVQVWQGVWAGAEWHCVGGTVSSQ